MISHDSFIVEDALISDCKIPVGDMLKPIA
jgi:hypothetical protein